MDDLLAFFDIIITFLVDLQHMIIININTTIVTAYIQFLCSNTSFSKLFSSAWLSCEVVVLIIIGVLCVVFNFWWQLLLPPQTLHLSTVAFPPGVPLQSFNLHVSYLYIS